MISSNHWQNSDLFKINCISTCKDKDALHLLLVCLAAWLVKRSCDLQHTWKVRVSMCLCSWYVQPYVLAGDCFRCPLSLCVRLLHSTGGPVAHANSLFWFSSWCPTLLNFPPRACRGFIIWYRGCRSVDQDGGGVWSVADWCTIDLSWCAVWDLVTFSAPCASSVSLLVMFSEGSSRDQSSPVWHDPGGGGLRASSIRSCLCCRQWALSAVCGRVSSLGCWSSRYKVWHRVQILGPPCIPSGVNFREDWANYHILVNQTFCRVSVYVGIQ